jgi:steroid delta-isomerase-like uncharacterized protein
MDTKWLDQWIAAWANRGEGSDSNTEAFLEAATEDIHYDDIHIANPIIGHDGLRQACAVVPQMLPGLRMTIKNRIISDDRWATEWDMTGTHAATQKTFQVKGATFGTLAPDGKVSSHMDYWNSSQLEAQVGAPLGG